MKQVSIKYMKINRLISLSRKRESHMSQHHEYEFRTQCIPISFLRNKTNNMEDVSRVLTIISNYFTNLPTF